MSFVLVLAAAVTLVVGLLQSGLTLIYLSIACSVLAGVVLAVAVLRGRPEPRPAAAGRSFTPPARAPVGASVGGAGGAEAAPSYTPPSYPAPQATPAPPPPPPPPTPEPAGEDLATKAAGSALLGRLRGRRGADAEAPSEAPTAEPEPVSTFAPEPAVEPEPVPAETTEVPVVGTRAGVDEDFPIPDYDRTRAIDLLTQLPALDRNQLEAVREREAAGKNRFTIMNRIDALLATKAEPAWEVEEEEWEAEEEEEEAVIAAGPVGQAAFDEELEEEFEVAGEVEGDEVDELVSPAESFPIAGYETLTVGQILPRLSDLDADQLAQVRAREQEGRARGTILDRIDRLAAKSGTGAGAMAMPPAPTTRKAPARRAAPAVKAPAARPARATKKAAIPVPPAPEPVKKARKARATKAVAVPPAAAPVKAPRKTPARKAAAAVVESEPMKAAVKKARAARKATKKA